MSIMETAVSFVQYFFFLAIFISLDLYPYPLPTKIFIISKILLRPYNIWITSKKMAFIIYYITTLTIIQKIIKNRGTVTLACS